GWYKRNVPLLDVPDSDAGSRVQAVYYYRWSTLKRSARYTDPSNGYVFLEFLEPPGYASAFGGVSAAAGHHLYEARWLRDLRYGDDYANYWLNGAGQGGVRQYSFWAADAAWARYQVTHDAELLKKNLRRLVSNYEGWRGKYDKGSGLYWQTPVWDAMEFTAATY